MDVKITYLNGSVFDTEIIHISFGFVAKRANLVLIQLNGGGRSSASR